MALAASRILRTALEPRRQDQFAEARDRLRASYLLFKERAALLSGEIQRDLPEFTVHDETHLDALWELVDLIVAPDTGLNPLEAYVLGGAILLHDLGLALASYPEGRAGLRDEPEWTDALIASLTQHLGRPPTQEERENVSPDVERETEQRILRQRHAAQAEKLADAAWVVDGETLHLIEDTELRTIYGPLMGRIAHSHWWPTADLPRQFDQPLGSPAWCPGTWVVAPLKLACWLRVADALHLDSRRAPLFLRAVRHPEAYSAEHWKFQEHLARPYLKNERLVFTAGKPFGPDDAKAWWLCYDTLALADCWIREVQAVLADSELEGLAIHGISGVDDPERLARLVQTQGWIPVDTQIEVSNVADLVLKLGGPELYGDNKSDTALRELIQNAADAVRARRVLQGLPQDWGQITVRLIEQGDDVWLEVHDTGIGMRQSTLTGALLDFGQSFWSSGKVTKEYPGLLSGGFSSIGQYGIGFYAVFMVGSVVEIHTRPYEAALADTQVLTFHEGVAERPILRQARQDEFLADGGTLVRVLLTEHEYLLFDGQEDGEDKHQLCHLCQWLAPALDVSLWTEERGADPVCAVQASDWLELDETTFLDRLTQGSEIDEPDDPWFDAASENLETITDSSGAILGRAAILPPYRYGFRSGLDGTVTIGGLRSSGLSGITGLLVGESLTAARDAGRPLVRSGDLASWATRQAESAVRFAADPEQLAEVAAVVVACGGSTGPLPIAITAGGWLTADEICDWARDLETILLIQDAGLGNEVRANGELTLANNVIAMDMGFPGIVQTERSRYRETEPWPMKPFSDPQNKHRGTLEGLVLELVLRAWNLPMDELQKLATFSSDDDAVSAVIGRRNEEDVFYDHLDVMDRS